MTTGRINQVAISKSFAIVQATAALHVLSILQKQKRIDSLMPRQIRDQNANSVPLQRTRFIASKVRGRAVGESLTSKPSEWHTCSAHRPCTCGKDGSRFTPASWPTCYRRWPRHTCMAVIDHHFRSYVQHHIQPRSEQQRHRIGKPTRSASWLRSRQDQPPWRRPKWS